MTDYADSVLQIYFPGICRRKVEAIKGLRSISRLNLKEAKDIIDTSVHEPQCVRIHCNPEIETVNYFIDLIKSEGGEVFFTSHAKYRESLEEIAFMATLAGDTYVAKSILKFMDEYMPENLDESQID